MRVTARRSDLRSIKGSSTLQRLQQPGAHGHFAKGGSGRRQTLESRLRLAVLIFLDLGEVVKWRPWHPSFIDYIDCATKARPKTACLPAHAHVGVF